MATIKAIEAKSVHQIQSGQVIVDLCSVVKELVENSLDAYASSLEVRFKNNGLDAIEVQDNGAGISAANYESVALKHHTSKLSNYDDLSSLQTFGFRGEALSSLCALSNFYITTAQAHEAPKGNRLDFESSGRLKSTSVVACQKGTTAVVEGLFDQLPVRRKELIKNIKREYGKVLGLLHAYACICTNVKFAVRNTMPKGKSITVFSTKANATTRENIANVYGAKTLSALVAFDLDLNLQPPLTQMSRDDANATNISVRGHISKPIFGEGRQTPDRQMFYVNGRPCGLPQIAKAINEVYRGFNVSQSPFVFADFQMDTNAYDVNVSPDKRTILLHNAATLIDRLKSALTDLFERQDQTVPQSQLQTPKLPSFKQLNIQREVSAESVGSAHSRQPSTTPEVDHLRDESSSEDQSDEHSDPSRFLHDHFRNQASTRNEPDPPQKESSESRLQNIRENRAKKVAKAFAEAEKQGQGENEYDYTSEMQSLRTNALRDHLSEERNVHGRDFNARMAEQQSSANKDDNASLYALEDSESVRSASEAPTMDLPNIVQDAFDRMRPRRAVAELATITVGDKTITKVIGTQVSREPTNSAVPASANTSSLRTISTKQASTQRFSQSISKFGAAGTQMLADHQSTSEEESESPGLTSDEATEDHPTLETETSLAPQARPQRRSGSEHSTSDMDPDYVDEAEKKAIEEAKVTELIRAAEAGGTLPSKDNLRRTNNALRGGTRKDSTYQLTTSIEITLADLAAQAGSIRGVPSSSQIAELTPNETTIAQSEEERLSLTVSKDDFPNMHIIGQFNLGFILAVRPSPFSQPSETEAKPSNISNTDELFIIDQHASDEKFNFERLQAETTVGNQRLVRAVVLDLTAVEEEVVLENLPILEKNGFIVEVDTSGDQVVGRRCKLTSLPLSKEVVFDTRDLEELIHLLAESPTLTQESIVPRPAKVRKMFAMRACRSSIMIGKTLSRKQMSTVLSHMGMIDKPWNCPHGRPTMRHLTSLNALDTWTEGDGVANEAHDGTSNSSEVWRSYIA